MLFNKGLENMQLWRGGSAWSSIRDVCETEARGLVARISHSGYRGLPQPNMINSALLFQGETAKIWEFTAV